MEIRVLLAGHGEISKTYLNTIKRIENMSIVGVVGRNKDRAKNFAKEYSIPFYGTNIKSLAHKSNANMIIICTPNEHHYQGVLDAADCGLHILCEKPMHFSPDRQNKMIEVCKKSGIKLGVCYRREFMKTYSITKEYIDSGKLGKILFIDTFMKFWRNPEYFTESSWHGKPELEGGGAFMQQGTHYVDISVWLGSGFKKVIKSHLFNLHQPISMEDHGYAIVEYMNGAVGVIEVSSVSKNNPYVSKLEITGTNGSILIINDKVTYWNVEGYDMPDFTDDMDAFEKQLRDFKEAIEYNREPLVNGDNGKIAVELVNEIYLQQSYFYNILGG